MNKRFFLVWLVVFIAWFMGMWLIHGMLLHEEYLQLAHLYRSDAEAQQYFHFMILAHVLMSGAFVWIYARGVEARPWVAQGARFGLAVVLLMNIPICLIYYVVTPMPGVLVVKQMAFEGILVLLLGMITAFFYKEAATATTAATRPA
jgi:hypothetical protein